MDCQNKNKNLDFCNCSYSSCPRKGLCCECLRYHLSQEELPACFFPDDAEKTYDRSIKHYLSIKGSK
ncbi:MAG: DUF6485 family protein [Candidatus Omnitrophica bacterium]|nr:DUF6485 family protein [Candidatus Omnitrophota bacterium]MCF7877648.1 DUF6485 family protein [Candidatus Omnitrophota bacterium]MCF7892293.1 DUF6485 family protein [Candidatus Omnitrophota bacterium]MCF7895944.1 DUF6485 family protein [Candidatus Omnitrophota bacterium]MCF7897970.1 DUF6485 family protein [Candidatus Omnitrophota bacterium]